MRSVVAVILAWGWFSSLAHAEQVTIRTRNGGNISGELIEYVENKQAVVRLGTERKLNVALHEVDTLTVGPGQASDCQLRATAQLKEGGTLAGKLIEYGLYQYVRISLGMGEPMRIESKDLKSVKLEGTTGPGCVAAKPSVQAPKVAPPPPAATTRSPAPTAANSYAEAAAPSAQPQFRQTDATLDAAARAAMIQSLMAERADWVARDTGLAAPLLFTLGGLVIAGAGAGIIAALVDDNENLAPGIATVAVGGAALATGLVFFSLRTSTGHQRRELQRIDEQLHGLGVQASVVPWLIPRGRTLADLSGGLSLKLTL